MQANRVFGFVQGGCDAMADKSFPRRLVHAAVVFLQERGVSRHARETKQSRKTIYRDSRQMRHELREAARVQS
jgi:hypothetical protein